MIKITAAAAVPDAFKERCLIGIRIDGGSEIQFAALTEDITGLDFGDKDIEGTALVGGGRVAKFTPMADESITLKLYPVSAKIAKSGTAGTATGAVQHFHPQSTVDTSDPILVNNTNTRNKHAVIILWAGTLPSQAGDEIGGDGTTVSYRIQIINAYMTSYKPSFDDKVFATEVTFKWTPFNKAGSANKREESCNGTETLPIATTSATSFA